MQVSANFTINIVLSSVYFSLLSVSLLIVLYGKVSEQVPSTSSSTVLPLILLIILNVVEYYFRFNSDILFLIF